MKLNLIFCILEK